MYANNFIEHEMEPPRDQLIDAYLPSYRRQQLPNYLDRKDWIEILLAAFSFIFDESEMRLNHRGFLESARQAGRQGIFLRQLNLWSQLSNTPTPSRNWLAEVQILCTKCE